MTPFKASDQVPRIASVHQSQKKIEKSASADDRYVRLIVSA